MKGIIALVSILSLCISCNHDSPKNVSNTTLSEIPKHEHQSDENTQAQQQPAQSKLPKSREYQTFINVFAEHIENLYCKEQPLERCYGMHEAMFKSDFMQKIPPTINFPYSEPFDWSALRSEPGFLKYWSYKCGFVDSENTVINYYCPNIKDEGRIWLDSLGQTNQLIKAFNSAYFQLHEIDKDVQYNFILNASQNLDFNNVDHRAFYWTYHLALTESNRAYQLIKHHSSEKQRKEGN